MNESHVVLKMDEYDELVNDLETVRRELIEHQNITEDAFGVKYSQFYQTPTFYTKKELNTEILKMFDTLQKDIERLQKENTQLKKPFWKRIWMK